MLHKHTLMPNEYLSQPITAYYCLDFFGFEKPGNPDFLNILKNDFKSQPKIILIESAIEVTTICKEHIDSILEQENLDTICIVPRSKRKLSYSQDQLYFLYSIKELFEKNLLRNKNVIDGTDYLVRHTNTKTTHFHNKPEYAGDGEYPYVGITKDTCHIASKLQGKSILLIDDIYTKTINIDEDCIQALLDNGAKKVVLFTIARTVHSSDKPVHSANKNIFSIHKHQPPIGIISDDGDIPF